MKKYFTLIICVVFCINYLHAQDNLNNNNSGTQIFKSSEWVDSVFNSMSYDEKISQLFMVAAYSNKGEKHIAEIKYLVEKYKIGGLIFFQGTPVAQAKLTNYYQSISKTPLLIGIDAEWGLAMRLDNTINYPRQMTLGAIQNDSLIYQMGADIAEQLKRIGVQVNFAPVSDINNNPRNPVINNRSFGENRENVANKSIMYMRGLQDNYVLATAKHFPGHGDTDKDSHKTLPTIKHSKKRLDSLEFYPFKQMINNGVGGIMVAHLNVPSLEKNNLPSTLSKNIVTNILKVELGFKGLAITDALNMKGITNDYKHGDIEAMALLAGNDILLFPQYVSRSISKIKQYVRKGYITKEQINESCKKILELKYWSGLDKIKTKSNIDGDTINLENIDSDLNKIKYQLTKRKLIEQSITLVENKNKLIPLKQLDTLKVASVNLGGKTVNIFQSTLSNYMSVDNYVADENFDILINKLESYNLVIVGIHNTNNSLYKNYGVKNQYIEFINKLSKKTKVIVDVFANPYSLKLFKNTNLDALIMSYHDDKITQSISAQIIFGGLAAKGKLPVSIEPKFPIGTGIDTKSLNRLNYTIPEDVGMSSNELMKIDSIANNAIKVHATPGCQILAARYGKVFYKKSFGYHTYQKKEEVKNNDIYDIASITKIVATMPSIMKLYDEGKFNIDTNLAYYLPKLDTTNKGDLQIIDILTHQARLNGWIPYYIKTLRGVYPDKDIYSTKFSEEYPYKIGKGFYLAKNFILQDSIYSVVKKEAYTTKIADNFYILDSFRDSIYDMIRKSSLLEKKKYHYSDLGFYYFYKIIENITNEDFPTYVDNNFYKKLGADRTGYLPLKRFSKNEIVPTEVDMIFRKQLLQAYVHDPGAAMLGGVCGHAGVFSTANDLAKIMQMYLQNGNYGGNKFFNDTTIKYFTTSPFLKNGNRRALGFDKPQMDYSKVGPTCQCVSGKSFGHTGFTGTMVWVDPETEILYIFLSNRIHPNQDNSKLVKMNVRTNIQQVIYDAIIE